MTDKEKKARQFFDDLNNEFQRISKIKSTYQASTEFLNTVKMVEKFYEGAYMDGYSLGYENGFMNGVSNWEQKNEQQ